MPIAWLVGYKADTIPETGAYNFPSAGSMATPFPRAPDANAASLISDNCFTSPLSGLKIISFLAFVAVVLWTAFVEPLTVSMVMFSSLLTPPKK